MQNYATATIEGFVTHDPVVKKTKTEKTVCTFSLAVNHYTKADAEPKVSFIEVETWEKIAEVCADSITKGRRVMVIGSLRQDRWENPDGKIRSRLKIVAGEVRFLESARTGRETRSQQEAQAV